MGFSPQRLTSEKIFAQLQKQGESGGIFHILLNRFVSLKDNPLENTQCQDGDEIMESERDRQHFDKEFMKAYIEDLKERGRLFILKII